ncbi:toll/interleukin-1 receptor domain-containing protein [Enterococcus faecalis]|nr:toll/interleukin-1 receptor domain-containing protein [Enterococcus faecalis]
MVAHLLVVLIGYLVGCALLGFCVSRFTMKEIEKTDTKFEKLQEKIESQLNRHRRKRMERIFRIYDPSFLDKLFSEASNQYRYCRFSVPIDKIGCIKNDNEFYFVRKAIESFFYYRFSKTVLVQWNRRKNLIEIGENCMKKKLTFRFPYEDYDCYYEVIQKINHLVDCIGVCILFVNKTHYSLETGMIVETQSNIEKIKEIAVRSGMKIDDSFGQEEIFNCMNNQQYNVVSLPFKADLEEIKLFVDSIFLLPSKKMMEERAFTLKTETKKKLFVSYCHKNKAEVEKIISGLREYGLDFWLDEEQIDVGDRLMERVDEGVRLSDIPIIFLSEATKEAMFAKHELFVFFDKVIYQQSTAKPWFIVKLDQVDPYDIIFGLGNLKYIDYEHSTIEEIAQAIEKR